MTFDPPPIGLRLIYLSDRLILHDISFSLDLVDPSNRNALINAANNVHTRHHSPRRAPNLIDVDFDLQAPPVSASPNSTSHDDHRYFVLPFASEHTPRDPPQPFETFDPQEAGLDANADASSLHVDVATAFLGVLPLHTAVFAILATQVRHSADLPSGPVFCVSKVTLLPLAPILPTKDDKDVITAITKMFESGAMYYSLQTDLSRPYGSTTSRKRPFQWNFPLLARLPSTKYTWSPACIYGFVSAHRMTVRTDKFTEFHLALVSRRSRHRAGTRFITRGVDAMGDVANFVETEQLVWRDRPMAPVASFLIIRGSIPVFWRQNNGIARPAPELDAGLVASRRAFAHHFDSLCDAYSSVCAVSLVDKHGPEAVLAQAFDRHFDLYQRKPNASTSQISLVAFDFHAYCAGKEYEGGLALLMKRLQPTVEDFGFSVYTSEAQPVVQSGVFRVNCVDCLDRTNVVQSMIARAVLIAQVSAVFADSSHAIFDPGSGTLRHESEDRFKHIWGDNADAISKQYSGTGALKTDFTRTGKRSTTGVIGDGVKSVMRMYYKNFVDEGRQEVIDILCGNAAVRQQLPFMSRDEGKPSLSAKADGDELRHPKATQQRVQPSSLWYSFEAMRVNAGGDKQAVYVELYDEVMYVTTSEGICFEYPRRSLLSWSKFDDAKMTDRRAPSRLRLVYKPSYATPATTSPLDLQFRSGMTMRENFLRALVSWAKPDAAALLTKDDVGVRVLTALNVGEHRLSDWGMGVDNGREERPEIVALIVPEVSAASRGFGLAAVPIDIDASGMVVISAFAVSNRGPAIAVLASPTAARTVMGVDEAFWAPSSSFVAGGAAAVSLEACGTSLCFVSMRVSGPSEVFNALTGCRLGRAGLDITAQFDHFFAAGLFGSVEWPSSHASDGMNNRTWAQIEDGSFCYSLDNGISIMRHSLPSLRYDDVLCAQSLWRTGAAHDMTCVCVADGLVDGRPAPQLPKSLSKCTVTVSEIRGENITVPRGLENTSQMLCSVVLHCGLATVDSVTSKAMTRATSCPEWNEELTLPMMPSDPEDVLESFVFGQVVVPSVMGDPLVAGCFVIHLTTARDGATRFDVRCRLGGKATGRIMGRVGVDIKMVTDEPPSHAAVERSSTTSGEPPPAPFKTQSVGQRVSDYAASLRPKGGLDDVNERFGAARKKGAKQVKSVVNRLSSLLSQPAAPSHSRPKARPLSLEDGGSHASRVRGDDYSEFPDFSASALATARELPLPPSDRRARASAPHHAFEARGGTANADTLDLRGLQDALGDTKRGSGSRIGGGSARGKASVPEMTDNLLTATTATALAPVSSTPANRAGDYGAGLNGAGKPANDVTADALLLGLEMNASVPASRDDEGSAKPAQPRHAAKAAVPPHVSDSADLLLTALTAHKRPTTTAPSAPLVTPPPTAHTSNAVLVGKSSTSIASGKPSSNVNDNYNIDYNNNNNNNNYGEIDNDDDDDDDNDNWWGEFESAPSVSPTTKTTSVNNIGSQRKHR